MGHPCTLWSVASSLICNDYHYCGAVPGILLHPMGAYTANNESIPLVNFTSMLFSFVKESSLSVV